MAAFGNPDTQREQAAYQIMGIPLGRGGVDGIRGADTIAARGLFAERMGIDPKDDAKIKEAIDAKLQDPKTRDTFLRVMSTVAPDKMNPSDAKAAQWLLKEGGRNMSKSIDPLTGMMDGRIGEDTRLAIAENRKRLPTQGEIQEYGGVNARFINDLVASQGWGYSRGKVDSPNVQAFDIASGFAKPAAPVAAAKVEADPPKLTTGLATSLAKRDM